MIPESIPNSIQNQCENDAQKNDAKIKENGANMDSKREPKPRQICRKYIPKRMVNIVKIPTVNIPTVQTKKNNMRGTLKTDKTNTPLARHSRKCGGGCIYRQCHQVIHPFNESSTKKGIAHMHYYICVISFIFI